MKYFVTGATGFIGGRVARQMLPAGHEGTTLARTPSQAHAMVAPACTSGAAFDAGRTPTGDCPNKAGLWTGRHQHHSRGVGDLSAREAPHDAQRHNVLLGVCG